MFAIVAESAQPSPYPHFRASISLPGVSKHFRICCDCCRTTASASSSRRPWSSPTGEVAMAASPLSATAFGSAAEGDIAFSKPGKSKCCTGVRRKRCAVKSVGLVRLLKLHQLRTAAGASSRLGKTEQLVSSASPMSVCVHCLWCATLAPLQSDLQEHLGELRIHRTSLMNHGLHSV
jgi:hypothetical protein